MTDAYDFSNLRAVFINCTLKPSPQVSNTQALMDLSIEIMEAHGVEVETLRFVDHDVPPGVYADMTEHGWLNDGWLTEVWPAIHAADILVVGGPLWLGDNASVTRKLIERLYAMSSDYNTNGQYVFYGKTAGAVITGNEDGVKHASSSILYSLQHVGYTIPPGADAGWIGEIGPGPSYLDPGSGGPKNDFTRRNLTFMTWNLMHLAAMLRGAGGIPAMGNVREQWNSGERFGLRPNPEYR